ncbi:MAG: glycosyltransferase [Thermodesulfobacteriota bacterium]|nr:glycosyltransferase [Thermodesulfobacteriota bacterium]
MSESVKTIPKIIHQTWETMDIPCEWQDCVRSWQEGHRDWEYRLWTDHDRRRLVEQSYPDFLEIFDSYSHGIQRADAIRYFVLLRYGGLYVDLDFECLRPVDDILSKSTFVIGHQPRKHAALHGEDSLVGNGFMASVPGHPFLLEIIGAMRAIDASIAFHHDVLSTTGPVMINNVLKAYAGDDVVVLEDTVVYPFARGSEELDRLIEKGAESLSLKKQCIRSGTYAIHYWANSWGRNFAGELINPDPFSVEGYTFFPGLDSEGYDIRNGGRVIESLAAECSRDYRALGFNTDGYLKYFIKPRSEWQKVDNRNGNEGLYIKKCVRVD